MSKRNTNVKGESVSKHACRLCDERFKKQRHLLSHRKKVHSYA